MPSFRLSIGRLCATTALYSASLLLLSSAYANSAISGLSGSTTSATGAITSLPIAYGNPVAGSEEWTCPHGFGTIYITNQNTANAARRLGCTPRTGNSGFASRR